MTVAASITEWDSYDEEIQILTSLVGPEHVPGVLQFAQKVPKNKLREWFAQLIESLVSPTTAAEALEYKYKPVGIEEFLLSSFYLNKRAELYPLVLKELIEINSGKYDEVILTGAIGTAKTSIALYSQAYQIYLLSCLDNPHKLFKLDSSSEIKLVFQNLNAKLAKGVDYARFRALIAGSAYFRNHFPYNKDVESMILFPNRIEVEPVAGTETAAIGQNVIGGIIDEVNFMQVVEHSKQASDGGVYNQAMALYQTIASRRKSRFMQAGGSQPGLLCLVSSKKVPGQFTDIKEAEAKTNKRIYVYNKRVWDIKPDVYCGRTFRVFVGDEYRRPKVLTDDELVPESDKELVDDIPVEHYDQFTGPGVDIVKAVRDIAGRSSLASYPFMADRELVSRCFSRRPNLCLDPSVDFAAHKARVLPSLAKQRPECPRWCHIDLAISKDHAGVVIGHVPGFKEVERADGLKEKLPIIEFDMILDVAPPPGGEINFAKIRALLYKLREMGLPVRWVSFDQFQSTDSQQILTSQGFTTGYQSMDKTNVPYEVLKQALYDDRVIAPKHDKLYRELVTLEIDLKKGKVDHPATSSKDVADAAAGVAFGLSMRREIWAQYGVPIVQSFVQQSEAVRSKNKIKE